MGPPPFGSGNVATGPTQRHWKGRFNGATAFRQWKRSVSLLKFSQVVHASMGPPPFGSGNDRQAMAICFNRCCFNGATAFRQWKRSGFTNPEGLASQLQWGHRLSAVETCERWRKIKWFTTLQWGHRLSAVETAYPTTRQTPLSTGFNGATAFRQWKLPTPLGRKGHSTCFNGATAFRQWKQMDARMGWSSGLRFNGATAFRQWKQDGCRQGFGMWAGFNGATAFRQWKPLFVL